MSKISNAHDRVARIHRTSVLSESNKTHSSSLNGSDLERALSMATMQSEKDSSKITSRPLEMASVSEIEDSKQMYLFDTKNVQLLTSIHAQLALRTINISETRKIAASCCKKYITSSGEIWSSPYVSSLDTLCLSLDSETATKTKKHPFFRIQIQFLPRNEKNATAKSFLESNQD